MDIFTNSNYVILFFQGILSFFSPCVLPLIPVYVTYLTTDASYKGEDGTIQYKQGKVLLTTVFFILGISSIFFIMALSAYALREFFKYNQLLISIFSGVVLILFGLMHLGILNISFLNKQYKLHAKVGKMSLLKAFLLGFAFSFGWTPCIGPALSAAILTASNTSSAFVGNLYILSYVLGFIIPFLCLGIFTKTILGMIQKHKHIMNYATKLGGFIIIFLGVSMIYTAAIKYQGKQVVIDTVAQSASQEQTQKKEEKKVYALDFELEDQLGNLHKQSDYKGKIVLLQFYATWCHYCNQEVPVLTKWAENQEDVQVLLVANPGLGNEVNKEEMIKILKERDITLPVLMDVEEKMISYYGVKAYPMTFMINKEGEVIGYQPGLLNEDIMNTLVEHTRGTTK